MWDKLTCSQFIGLYDIDNNDRLNIVEKQQLMLGVIEGKNPEEYDTIKYKDLLEKCSKKLSFFSELPESKPVDYLEVNGNRYKFCFEVSEITAGQYIDISTFSGNIMELNKIAACFFLPMKGKRYMEYGSVPHDKVAEDLLDANFLELYGCMVFFCQLLKGLINDMETFSNLTQEQRERLTHLWENGVGYTQLSK
jgi:hypothetical protein